MVEFDKSVLHNNTLGWLVHKHTHTHMYGYGFLPWLWAKQTIMTVIKPSCRSSANNPTSPFQKLPWISTGTKIYISVNKPLKQEVALIWYTCICEAVNKSSFLSLCIFSILGCWLTPDVTRGRGGLGGWGFCFNFSSVKAHTRNAAEEMWSGMLGLLWVYLWIPSTIHSF